MHFKLKDCIASITVAVTLASCPLPVFAHGQVSEQISSVTQEIHNDKGNETLLLKRGRLYFEDAIYDHAIEDFNAALDISPKSANAFYWRSRSYFMLQNYPKALQDANQFVSMVDNNNARARGYELLGDVKLAKKNNKEAANAYEKAATLFSNPSPQIFTKAISALSRLDSSGVIRARSLIQSGIKQLGHLAVFYRSAIDMELHHGNHDAALNWMEAWLGQEPNNPFLQAELSELLHSAGELERALELAKNSLRVINSMGNVRRNTPAYKNLTQKANEQINILKLELAEIAHTNAKD